jgi:predicted metal-dependent peptidase
MPEKISEVCVRWQTDSPFFAEFLLRFLYIEDSESPSAGVYVHDNKLFFFYNKEFIERLNTIEVEAVCVHEIMHILNRFFNRLGARNKDWFNVAQDLCINEVVETTTISSRKLKLPMLLDKEGNEVPPCRFPFKIKGKEYQGEHISEPIYDFIEANADKIVIYVGGGGGGGGNGEGGGCPTCGAPQDGTGEGSGDGQGQDKSKNSGGGGKDKKKEHQHQGGGTGNPSNDSRCPTCGKQIIHTLDDHRKQRELTEIEKQAIEEVINNARTRSWGNISGNMQSVIKELLTVASIPWQQKLARYMSKYVNEPGTIYENTWSKRNRRSLPLPGIRKLSKRIIVTVDTSGSIADEDIMIFFGQIEKIVKDFSYLTLIQWDTTIHSIAPYRKGDWRKIKIIGRGGTAVQDLYDLIHKDFKTATLIVNFTDGYFDWNINHYNVPTIWAVINNDAITVPFGNLIIVKRIKDGNK